MEISSPAFTDGSAIPKQYTGDGHNLSPPVRWHDVPAGAAELVLVVEDPDAPRADPFVHWLVYKIPADAPGLPAGVPHEEQLVNPPGALQGLNDFPDHSLGYRGPLPPAGDEEHNYRFTLYALDEPLDVGPAVTKPDLLEAMRDHILESAELVGTYERER